MFYRIIIILIALAGLYTVTGVVIFKWMHHGIENPRADFQIYDNGQDDDGKNITVIEFLNYGCGYCKKLHPVMKEILELRDDVQYIVRPAAFGNERMVALNNLVIAAGLQDKFWEMHDAVLEYPEQDVPDSFIEETASLYNIDYQRLVNDAQGEEVKKISDNNFRAMRNAKISTVPSFVINGEFFIVKDERLPTLQDMLSLITNAEK